MSAVASFFVDACIALAAMLGSLLLLGILCVAAITSLFVVGWLLSIAYRQARISYRRYRRL